MIFLFTFNRINAPSKYIVKTEKHILTKMVGKFLTFSYKHIIIIQWKISVGLENRKNKIKLEISVGLENSKNKIK